MNDSIYNGTSALLSFQKAIDVESNNVANVNTIGFKSDTISFADMMYDRGVGKGVTMLDPVKNFQQGQLKPTGKEYDFTLSGDGFFTVALQEDPTVQYYTRAGNFRKSDDSFLVDANDMYVMGNVPAITGDKITSEFTQNLGSSIVENANSVVSINTFATDYKKTATTTGVSGSNYKTPGANINDIEALKTAYRTALKAYSVDAQVGTPATQNQDTIAFPMTPANNGAYTVEVTIDGTKFQQEFDTSVAKTLNLLSDKVNQYTGVTSSVDTATGIMTVDSIIPGQKINVTNAKLNDSKVVITSQTVAAGSGQNLVDAIYAQLETLITANGGQIASTRSEITKTATGSAPNAQEISLNLDTLNISDDAFGTLVNDNGNLYLEQGDARFLVGRLEPVSFSDNSGLKPEGNNLYSKTIDSGDPVYSAAKAVVLNEYLEISTSDLSEGLVNLMVWQKAFDANSKSVTTSDELLKTALQLKAR